MRYVANRTFQDFAVDEQAVDATVRALEIMGEAAKRMPEDVRAMEPAIPWRRLAGLRDVLIHGYDRVDLDIVWNTVRCGVSTVAPPRSPAARAGAA